MLPCIPPILCAFIVIQFPSTNIIVYYNYLSFKIQFFFKEIKKSEYFVSTQTYLPFCYSLFLHEDPGFSLVYFLTLKNFNISCSAGLLVIILGAFVYLIISLLSLFFKDVFDECSQFCYTW